MTLTTSRSRSGPASAQQARKRAGALLASTEALRERHARRQRPELLGESRDQRGPRRRDRLPLDIVGVGRDADEQLERRGRGERQPTVSGVDATASERKRGARDARDAELLERAAHADDVADGVDGAHLVEVDVVGRDAVHPRLGFGQPRKDAQAALADPLGKRRALEQRANRRELALGRRALGSAKRHVAARQSTALDLRDLQDHRLDVERRQRLSHRAGGRAQIEKRPQDHVPRCAGEAVEVELAPGAGEPVPDVSD